jgi:hypothetical protein
MKYNLKSLQVLLLLFVSLTAVTGQNPMIYIENFKNPQPDYWPHTRWWWHGNCVSKEGITWELEQMKSHGITGVEQITMAPFYEKGNIPYLSDEYLEMAKHTVNEAKRLGMEVSFNFGGPGWIIGGDWVSEADKSKDMVPTSVVVDGPQLLKGTLPNQLTRTKRSWEIFEPTLSGNEILLAVVAGKITGNKIDPKSLTIITENVKSNKLVWQVPEGKWRIMAFWLKKNGHANAVDHFSVEAMKRYCEYVGGRYKAYVGDEFGKTVDSFFADSFELPNLASGIYWSDGLLEKFRKDFGYDLVPYLPAIWWDVDGISPKIRYDVNLFLHKTGMEAFFVPFMNYCHENSIKGRVQTYGFTTDNIEATGMTDIPEMEITAGEKDAADWFDTRIGPRKYVESGAHIYGRDTVSSEVYTFMHWERYRETLEELKIASDSYLREGATKFYNHGFSYSPERDVAPTRMSPFATFIQPQNTWWNYYPKLAGYIARCSYLLRQGDFAPDIAVYSPLANQWTKDVLNPRKWTREFDWGELGNLLIANGYDFDLLNDDALQNIAKIENGNIRIRKMEYKILILPNVESIPLETMQFVEKVVKAGGTVIALERVPEFSTGFNNFASNDSLVKQLSAALFIKPAFTDDTALKKVGKGQTYQINTVLDRSIWWDRRSSTLDPFVNTLRKHIAPDFGIDFAKEGLRKNEGLTFHHRKLDETDIYFVTNIQDKTSTVPVTVRTKNRKIQKWNPYNGQISDVYHFKAEENGTTIPLILAPYESAFYIFSPGETENFVTQTNLNEIISANETGFTGTASTNGVYFATVSYGKEEKTCTFQVSGIPAPFNISGQWTMELEGKQFPKITRTTQVLSSWTDDETTRHFSGTGKYTISFELPAGYIAPDLELLLDVGKVGQIAEVIINGKNAGVVWMRGQNPEISKLVKAGENNMEVLVTNTLINRVSAMTEPNPIPAELVPVYGSTPTQTPGSLPREFGFQPLPASGLLGPVMIIPVKKVRIEK